jgi:hypothetical protein
LIEARQFTLRAVRRFYEIACLLHRNQVFVN